MRVAIAGGNGFIGRRLTQDLLDGGHEVVWLSHRPGRHTPPPSVREIPFDFRDDAGSWAAEVRAAEAVVNLSGHPIASRWSETAKRQLETSRIDTTRALGRQIAEARLIADAPVVFVVASGAGIYGDRGDEFLAEDSGPGEDWLAQLAVRWEGEAQATSTCGCRIVSVRTGLVLGDEGLVPRMALPMRLFVGGPVGSGRQWTPWLHHADIAGIYRFAIEDARLEGPVNACAPEPVRMREFAVELGRAMKRPSWFPVPEFMLKLVLGEVAPYMLFSQRVSCEKLQHAGYEFRHPELYEALKTIV